MLNLKLAAGDMQGDMVPTPTSPHISPGGSPSVRLGIGNSLYSPGGTFRLHLQNDGNAVLQCIDDATLPRQWQTGQVLDPSTLNWANPIWNAGTSDRGVIELDMQADGNLVVYSGAGPIFNSVTENNQGAFLRMQDDGNLVIYSKAGVALWNTRTFARAATA